MLKQNTAIPLVITATFAATFIWGLSFIAIMDHAPSGELEVRFRYLSRYINRDDNGTLVNFRVQSGSESRNVSLITRDVHVRSVALQTGTTTPVTLHAWDQFGFTWEHTVSVLELIDEHWIDTYVEYYLGTKYLLEICFTWTRNADNS